MDTTALATWNQVIETNQQLSAASVQHATPQTPVTCAAAPTASLAQMALDNLLALCHLLAKAGGVVSPRLLADGHQQHRTGSHLLPPFGSRC